MEAALIDALGGPGKLTNRVRGIDAATLGRQREIEAKNNPQGPIVYVNF